MMTMVQGCAFTPHSVLTLLRGGAQNGGILKHAVHLDEGMPHEHHTSTTVVVVQVCLAVRLTASEKNSEVLDTTESYTAATENST